MESSNWWIAVIVVLTVLFLLPQVARLFLRRVHYFSGDLRSILISSLDDGEGRNGMTANSSVGARHVNLIVTPKQHINAEIVTLTIDGTKFTTTTKILKKEAGEGKDSITTIDETSKFIEEKEGIIKH